MEIKIANKTYPMFFSMLTIERIMNANKMVDFDALQQTQNLADSMKFARDCAYWGIHAGMKKEGQKFPFQSSEDIAELVESFEELQPAIEGFTQAVTGFFQPKEVSEAK